MEIYRLQACRRKNKRAHETPECSIACESSYLNFGITHETCNNNY